MTSTFPRNFQRIISDGASVPLPENSVNVAYSNQVMEHLHPDDAFEQIQNIYDSLSCTGIYICITPSRLNGPHDISRHFDTVPMGLHLREYSASELISLFKEVGFSKVRTYMGGKGFFATFPEFLVRSLETTLEAIPYSSRRALMRSLPFRMLSTIRIVGSK